MDKLQTILRLSNTSLTYHEDSLTISSQYHDEMDETVIDPIFEFLSPEHAVVFGKLFMASIKIGRIEKTHLNAIFPDFNAQALSLIFKLTTELSDVLPLTIEFRSCGCEINFDSDYKQSLLRNTTFDCDLDGKSWLQIVECAHKMAQKHFLDNISENYFKRFLSQNFVISSMLEFSFKWQFLPVWERFIIFKLANDQMKAPFVEMPPYLDLELATLITLGMEGHTYTLDFQDLIELQFDPSGDVIGYQLQDLKNVKNHTIREDNLKQALDIVKDGLTEIDVCFKKIGICSSSDTYKTIIDFIAKKKYDFEVFRLADILLYEGQEQLDRIEKISIEIKSFMDKPSAGRKFAFIDYEMVKGIANDSSKALLYELINNILYHQVINASIIIRTDDLCEFDFTTIVELDEDNPWDKEKMYERRHATRVAYLKNRRGKK